METSRLEIKTIDRPNMTHDISGVFVKYNIDIIWMEVYTFVVYVKFKKLSKDLQGLIVSEILSLNGVKSVDEINLISFEEKQIEIKHIMDAVWQGVVVLDKDEKIKYINKYALENVFFQPENKIINKDVNELLKVQYTKLKSALNDIESKKEIKDFEVMIGAKNYLMSVNAMISSEDVFLGYILMIQDSKRMDKILSSKRYDNQISFKDIIGQSEQILKCINDAKVYSQSDSPVLITGESGTGKEIFARALHNLSSRSRAPFVAVNCGAIPDQLLESELFGYEGGSFTGAKSDGKLGIFEIANGGTIFLDEIGEMPPHLQVKLLRVLQEKKMRKIGGDKETRINVRIISATNKNLNEMVESNQFRLDLFYRINIFTITIPPLRRRKKDIEVLAKFYMEQFSQKYNKNIEKISDEAMDKMLNYEWYGNVRELQNVVERTVALNYTGEIKKQDVVLNKSMNIACTNTPTSLKDTLGSVEREIILKALNNHDSIRACAKTLEVSHTLLINRIKKYKIKDSEWRNY